MYVSYISEWQKAFINAQHLNGSTYTLSVIDIMGRIVFKEQSGASTSLSMTHDGYLTKDLDCATFSKGMYIVTLKTNLEQLSQKFIKQ